ncbi:MAG: MFS transporter, partial [Rhodospirillales bacterium]|nr:MFS transporter [Rhodospirillales bacterium]
SRPAVTPSFRHIVWPLAVAETVVWAAMYYAFPALLPAWEAELGWTKTELSGAFTLALVVSAALAPVAGRLIDNGHGRQAFTGGAVLGALMLALLSQVTALWQFYAIWVGLGVAMSSTLYEACFAVLTLAMGPHAKRAITLVTLAAGFAGTLSFPSAHALAGAFGWRGAVLVFAAAVAVVAVPLIWIGCQRAEQHAATHAPQASPRASHALGVTRSARFWLLVVAFAMIALDHGAVITHVLPILEDRGVHEEAAVLAASMIGPMQVAGRLAMMTAERHVSTLAISLGCYLALGLAAGALLGASAVPGLVVGFVIFQGAGIGVTSIIRPVVVAELLGRTNFGVVSGLLAVPYMGGYAAGPTIAALVWERGGYDLVLLLAILAAVLGLLALLAAWRSAPLRPGEGGA